MNTNFSRCESYYDDVITPVNIARDQGVIPQFYNFTKDFPGYTRFYVTDDEQFLFMDKCYQRLVSTLFSDQDTLSIGPNIDLELDFSAVQPGQTQGFCVMDKDRKTCSLQSPPLRSETGIEVNMTESYAICTAGYDATKGLVCQPAGWKNVTFKIDQDPSDKATWHNPSWLFSNYSFTAECPDKNCCVRLEAKSKREFKGISDHASLPISISTYNEDTGMYQSPLLCEKDLKLFPSWTLDNSDEALKVVCQIDNDEQF